MYNQKTTYILLTLTKTASLLWVRQEASRKPTDLTALMEIVSQDEREKAGIVVVEE